MSDGRPDYVVIVGHGRSGTNWLVDLIDISRETHCRSEPEGVRGGALNRMPGADFDRECDDVLDAKWDDAVRVVSMRFGERDRRAVRRKAYLHELPRRLGLTRLVLDSHARSRLGRLLPSLRSGEWRLPKFAGSEERLARALHVLKLAGDPGWAAWVLRNRPRVATLHIIRHPGGFLNSWRNRYFGKHDAAEVVAANRRRLERLVELHPEWAKLLGPIAGMSAEESELWYWRYAMEAICEAGEGRPGYRLVVYERLAADPIAVMRDVYAACGLPWTTEVAAGMNAISRESENIADAWRSKLAPEHRALVERILAGSPLRSIWPEAS